MPVSHLPESVPPPIRVAVASGSPAIRSGLRALLDGRDGIEVADEWPWPRVESPALGVDVLVGEANIFEDAEWHDLAASLPVVLIGARESLLRVFPLLTAGFGLLSNEATGSEIAAAVRAAAQGLAVFDPGLLLQPGLSITERPLEPAAGSPLTARELEVLRLVAAGLPNKTIALQLSISDHTVKFHLGSIMGKLGAASRTEAVALAIRNGLIPL